MGSRDEFGASRAAVGEVPVRAVPLEDVGVAQPEGFESCGVGGEGGDGEGLLPVGADLLVVSLNEQVVADLVNIGVAAVAGQRDDCAHVLVGLGEFDRVDRSGGVTVGPDPGWIDEGEGFEVGEAVGRSGHDLRVDAVLGGVPVAELVDAEDDETAPRQFDGPEGGRRLLVRLVAVKGEESGCRVLLGHPGRSVDLRGHGNVRFGHEFDGPNVDAPESPVGFDAEECS
ncbi:Uncharacterised protein [Chlamydia trachomatis]|nr:Uncharacterised protein [Chlamydia trachomatis]